MAKKETVKTATLVELGKMGEQIVAHIKATAKVDDRMRFNARGFRTETRVGNVMEKTETNSLVTFFNQQKKEYNLQTGQNISTLEFCSRVKTWTKLADVFGSDARRDAVDRQAVFLTRRLKTAFAIPDDILPPKTNIKHSAILAILKAGAEVLTPQSVMMAKVVKADGTAKKVELKKRPAQKARVQATA